jgi:2-polyprenyl-3-methyl-5-hydroxy-6-metoxy-1,4-benzoquinol methylase
MSYLAENNTFYSSVMSQNRLYSTPHPNSEEAARASVILKYLSIIRQHYIDPGLTPRLLDLGCGRGWLTMMISAFGRAEGIEPAEGMVALAEAYFPNIVFNCGTLSDCLQSSGAKPYDVIVTSEVIEHVPRPKKKDFVREINSALKPNGHCIITTPRRELFKLFSRNHTAGQLIEDWLTEKELRSLFKQCGFVAIDHDRAFAMKPRFLNHPYSNSNVNRFSPPGKLKFLMSGLDYILSIYQVWWFRKRT